MKGLIGETHARIPTSCTATRAGRRFEDATQDAGLDMVFAAMGSNYGDFDNDGYLDMYLGTGEPNLETLVPNRMFKGLEGKSFVEITGSAGVGHLQKGHGVACGDWDRDGNVDVFIQMGGAVDGDKYHNILFQNPGHKNAWLTVKLVGQKTNRAALGARIKLVTAGDNPLTIHRHISPGSSFGGEPAGADYRSGQCRADRRAGNPLAHQRHDAGLSRPGGQSGDPGDRIRGPVRGPGLPADPRAQELNEQVTACAWPWIAGPALL